MQLALPTRVVCGLLILGTIVSFAGTWHYMLDNLSSFKVHFALAFFVCALVFAVTRDTVWLLAAGIGLAANLASIVPWYLPAPESRVGDDAIKITVLSSNVSSRNDDPAKLVELVNQEQPDILGLIEVTPGFLGGVDAGLGHLPFRHEAAAEGFWGLALYSRLPLSDTGITRFGDTVPPSLTATVQLGGTEVELILVHPFPPMTANLAKRRNTQLDQMARYIRESDKQVVLIGDLNTAMWSPYYDSFVELTGLRNARMGFGVTSTWPPTRFLGVPIDHIFHSESFITEEFRVLSNIGSDHLPIAADLVVPSPYVDDAGAGMPKQAVDASSIDSRGR